MLGQNGLNAAILAVVGAAIFACAVFARAATDVANSSTNDSSAKVEGEAIRHGDALPAASSGKAQAVRTGDPIDLHRIAYSLAIVIALIFAARFALKRFFPTVSIGKNSQVVRVLSRSVIAPKQQFLLVQLGRRLILVGDSGGNMNRLAEVSDPDEVAALIGQLRAESNVSTSSAFAPFFSRAGSEYREELAAAATDKNAAETVDEPGDEPADESATSSADRGLVQTSNEIRGLMDRVRRLSNRMR